MPQHKHRHQPTPEFDADVDADRAARIKTACKIAAGTVPIAGTLAERDLKQVRGISEPATDLPEAIR